MLLRRIHIAYLLFALPVASLLTSCASYNMQVKDYYGYLQQGDYKRAARSLDKNRLLKKNRNHLLYLLERGKVSYLMNEWDNSNKYFNEADYIIENNRSSAKDLLVGTLVNPMMQSYKAEDFEKYLVHYYKALNYLQLSEPEEAMVEARRISLQAYAQEDKTGNKKKYSDDAFSFMLQGMIYEKNGDINNAFIAYRNAADVYIDHGFNYYGTKMPEQLKKDLLRTAYLNGFADEQERYEKLLNTVYTKEEKTESGELIIFWENGSAPVKTQQDIWFSLFKDQGGGLFFSDAAGNYNVPFNATNGYNNNNVEPGDLRSFRVALPKYETQPMAYSGARLEINNTSYQMEAAENINTLAFTTLKERMFRELSSTLTRLAVKKLAEAAVRPGEKQEDNGKKTEEEKKKAEKNRAEREAFALGLQLFNFASEKADTRNWQSLPHTIYYTRVPLQKGENKLTLRFDGSSAPGREITVNGNGGLQFLNVCTLK